MGTRAAIYTRISETDGVSESPERQEADCRTLAHQRGWTVSTVLSDRESAFNPNAHRPGYEKLMRAMGAGDVDALVVWKLDRLTRGGLAGITPVLEVLQSVGAELVSVTETIDTTTPMGEAMLGVLASMAKQESLNTSLRVKRAHQSSAASGRMHSGGSRQYGLTRDGRIVPEEAAIVREAMDRVLAGESLRQIARDLNARGIPTTTAGERRKLRPNQKLPEGAELGEDGRYELRGEWRSVTLGQMLRSPRLAGLRVHNGDVVAGDWDPIVTADEHAALLRALAQPRRGPRTENRSYLLTGAGVIRCGLCLRPMRRMSFRMKNGRLFHRYQCLKQPGQGQCGKVNVTQTSVDEFVVGELLDFLDYAELRPLDGDESETELETRLAGARTSLGELDAERFIRRTMAADRYEVLRQPLEAEVSELEARLLAIQRRREERVQAIPLGDREALGAWWEAAPDPEKIAAVRPAIRSVTIKPAKRRGGNRFDHTRVEIDWNWEMFRMTEAGRALERFWCEV